MPGVNLRVVFVDTADVCRAPAAAVLLVAEAEARSVPVEAGSAGLSVSPGTPVGPVLLRVAGEHARRLRHHGARAVRPDVLEDADLVLCMERRHLRQIANAFPAALPWTFTYEGFLRAAGLHPPSGQGLAMWLPELHERRTPEEVTSTYTGDDIASPTGWSLRGHRRMWSELRELAEDLMDVLEATGGRLPLGGRSGHPFDRASQASEAPPASIRRLRGQP